MISAGEEFDGAEKACWAQLARRINGGPGATLFGL